MSKFKKSREPQSSGRRWTQWKEPDAHKAISEWRGSGLSAAAFCAREGYTETRLRYWLERLGKRLDRRVDPSTVTFVPVALAAGPEVRHIEIECGGVVLRVREDLDVEHVARLVTALATREQTC
jgi:hypothetical protein